MALEIELGREFQYPAHSADLSFRRPCLPSGPPGPDWRSTSGSSAWKNTGQPLNLPRVLSRSLQLSNDTEDRAGSRYTLYGKSAQGSDSRVTHANRTAGQAEDVVSGPSWQNVSRYPGETASLGIAAIRVTPPFIAAPRRRLQRPPSGMRLPTWPGRRGRCHRVSYIASVNVSVNEPWKQKRVP